MGNRPPILIVLSWAVAFPTPRVAIPAKARTASKPRLYINPSRPEQSCQPINESLGPTIASGRKGKGLPRPRSRRLAATPGCARAPARVTRALSRPARIVCVLMPGVSPAETIDVIGHLCEPRAEAVDNVLN